MGLSTWMRLGRKRFDSTNYRDATQIVVFKGRSSNVDLHDLGDLTNKYEARLLFIGYNLSDLPWRVASSSNYHGDSVELP